MPLQQQFSEPILFLIFNRLDTTKQVFDVIKTVKPQKLYIAADGYRASKPGEQEVCAAVRDYVMSNVNWDCKVETLFRDTNLGCKLAVSSAITWFFNHEERGIILEDDCLPSLSFFSYCSQLLERYKNDDKVMTIGGYSPLKTWSNDEESYHFSAYFHCWGWASWRRAWQLYDKDMKKWPMYKKQNRLSEVEKGILFKAYWSDILDDTYNGKINTWDYQFGFALWAEGGLSITPTQNLVTNIGFGEGATHTVANAPLKQKKEISFPLIHPAKINRNVQYDMLETKHEYNVTLPSEIKRRAIRKAMRNDFIVHTAKKILGKKH